VSGAVHRASWRSCGARGRRWGRGCAFAASSVFFASAAFLSSSAALFFAAALAHACAASSFRVASAAFLSSSAAFFFASAFLRAFSASVFSLLILALFKLAKSILVSRFLSPPFCWSKAAPAPDGTGFFSWQCNRHWETSGVTNRLIASFSERISAFKLSDYTALLDTKTVSIFKHKILAACSIQTAFAFCTRKSTLTSLMQTIYIKRKMGHDPSNC
jgi:cellulose synthase/poly-beta-1,6-N-acetylglucosamine synthase-like glycosyltransferase